MGARSSSSTGCTSERGRWLVRDVVVDGHQHDRQLSRAEFRRVLRQGSYATLIAPAPREARRRHADVSRSRRTCRRRPRRRRHGRARRHAWPLARRSSVPGRERPLRRRSHSAPPVAKASTPGGREAEHADGREGEHAARPRGRARRRPSEPSTPMVAKAAAPPAPATPPRTPRVAMAPVVAAAGRCPVAPQHGRH